MEVSPQISTWKDLVNKELESVPNGTQPANLYDPIRYILGLGGKRFRPMLVLLSYSLFRDDIERIARAAAGVELFHNFTLVHDDIMDKAPLRRGNATVHEKWGHNTAILSGDVMLVETYGLVLDAPDEIAPHVLRSFNDCAAKVCEGQQIDMNFETADSVTEAEYIEMIRLKTAVLLGFSMEFGALLAKAPTETVATLKEFGEAIGIGFQLKDDLLDAFADAGKFGKQVGGDIIANKKTFLWIKAMEAANEEQRAELKRWESDTSSDPEEKVRAVKKVYAELRIQKLAEDAARGYFDRAFSLIDQLQVETDRKEPLVSFVNQLMGREH